MASSHSQHRSAKVSGNKIVISSWDDIIASKCPQNEPIPDGWLSVSDIVRITGKSASTVLHTMQKTPEASIPRKQFRNLNLQGRMVWYYYLPGLKPSSART